MFRYMFTFKPELILERASTVPLKIQKIKDIIALLGYIGINNRDFFEDYFNENHPNWRELIRKKKKIIKLKILIVDWKIKNENVMDWQV